MTYKIGDRVGAILGATQDAVEFLGYGIYQGEEVPDDKACGMAALMFQCGMVNPKILLDSGKVVWGGECWWGSEESVKARLAEYPTVTQMDIDEVRATAGKWHLDKEKDA